MAYYCPQIFNFQNAAKGPLLILYIIFRDEDNTLIKKNKIKKAYIQATLRCSLNIDQINYYLFKVCSSIIYFFKVGQKLIINKKYICILHFLEQIWEIVMPQHCGTKTHRKTATNVFYRSMTDNVIYEYTEFSVFNLVINSQMSVNYLSRRNWFNF